MYLHFLRLNALALIMCFLLGCSADDSIDNIPTVTIEVVEQLPNEETIRFRLSAEPVPKADLAVLVESQIWTGGPTGRESNHMWVMIPKFVNSKEFGLSLDKYISWEVAILPLSGVNLNDYPIGGFGIPADFKFSGYTPGNPSKVVTEQKYPAKLRNVWPNSYSMPANATFVLNFDLLPEDIKASRGRVIIEGDVVKVVGPFPVGRLQLEISWDGGHGNRTIRQTISESDFKPPKLVQATAYVKGGWGISFFVERFSIESGQVPHDAERIELIFDEAVWFDEKIHGKIKVQTLAGDDMGWEEAYHLLSFKDNEIVIALSDGKPLERESTYVVVGTVTDLANEIEFKRTFTTGD